MRFIKPEVSTVCVGSAFGEAAMLLAAGAAVSALQLVRWHRPGGRAESLAAAPAPAACLARQACCLLLLDLFAPCHHSSPPPTTPHPTHPVQLPTGFPDPPPPRPAPPRSALQGKRAALPSASIMIRQPMQRFAQMQASDVDIYRNEIRKTNAQVVRQAAAPLLGGPSVGQVVQSGYGPLRGGVGPRGRERLAAAWHICTPAGVKAAQHGLQFDPCWGCWPQRQWPCGAGAAQLPLFFRSPASWALPHAQASIPGPSPVFSAQVELLAKHTGHSQEKIAKDISRPKYFDPYTAVEYNLIDRVGR